MLRRDVRRAIRAGSSAELHNVSERIFLRPQCTCRLLPIVRQMIQYIRIVHLGVEARLVHSVTLRHKINKLHVPVVFSAPLLFKSHAYSTTWQQNFA